MKGNESTDLKNLEGNALDNAVKYLTVAGYQNIAIIVSNEKIDDFLCVERYVIKDSDTYNRWRYLMVRLYRLLAKFKKEGKK